MRKRLRTTAAMIVGIVLLIIAVPILGACATGASPTATPAATPTAVKVAIPTPTSVAIVSEFDVVQAAVDAYLNSGATMNIAAKDLYMLLNDDDKTNDPYIISVRSAEQYAKGHIAGAVDVAWGDIVKEANLAKLPKDKQIVVYCYTGHSGSQATAKLGALDYKVSNLKWGMCDWTKDAEIAPSCFDPATDRMDYATETKANEATKTNKLPTVENTKSTDNAEIVRAAADAYASAKNITAKDLYMLLKDDDKTNDPFIVSIRSAADYAKGHIPGAVNIALSDLAKQENLAKLPADNPIVVYCYTGHTGSQATALLNMLGYDATNLKWGIVSWTKDATIAPGAFDPAKANDYPVVTGSSPTK